MSHPDPDEYLAQRHPETLQHIGIIATLSALIDFQLAILLASVLGVRVGTGIAILFTLTGTNLRRKVILNTIETVDIKASDKKEINNILKQVSSVMARRNKMVHSLPAYKGAPGDYTPLLLWTQAYHGHHLGEMHWPTLKELRELSSKLRRLSERIEKVVNNISGDTPL